MVGAALVLALSSALEPSAVQAQGSAPRAPVTSLRAPALRVYQQKNYDVARTMCVPTGCASSRATSLDAAGWDAARRVL